MGEATNSQTEADDLSGRTQKDRGSAAGEVGEGESEVSNLVSGFTDSPATNRAASALVLLREFVISVPVAFGVPPEPEQRGRESYWWSGCSERLTKIVQGQNH